MWCELFNHPSPPVRAAVNQIGRANSVTFKIEPVIDESHVSRIISHSNFRYDSGKPRIENPFHRFLKSRKRNDNSNPTQRKIKIESLIRIFSS